MSFILRRISTTKTGKQIVRDQPLPGTSITLGRDGGNTIHVADLAVNPQHATISSADGRHVRVQASEGLGFDLNGRTLDIADSGHPGQFEFLDMVLVELGDAQLACDDHAGGPRNWLSNASGERLADGFYIRSPRQRLTGGAFGEALSQLGEKL